MAAVDEALLELKPNDSWDLFDAMIRHRDYGVETATAQMQIIGKRHFGKKAAPRGRRRRAVPDARTVRHAAAVEPARGARRQRRGRGHACR